MPARDYLAANPVVRHVVSPQDELMIFTRSIPTAPQGYADRPMAPSASRSPRSPSRVRNRWGWVAGVILSIGVTGAGRATATTPPPNPEQLRSPLIQAFKDWKWVGDRVVTVPPNYYGSSRYWLVTLEPQREGELILRYEFQQANSRYQGGDRSYFVRVGPRGCQRELTIESFSYGASRHPDLCLGDRFVMPIELPANYFNYRFSDRDPIMTQVYVRPKPPLPNSFDPSPVPNPVAAWLAYRGRHFEMVSTRGGDREVTWQAHWQAIATGRWNLELAMQPSPELRALTIETANSSEEAYRTQVSGPEDKTVLPIVVLPAGMPLNVLPLTMRGDNYYAPGPSASNSSSMSDQFPVGQLVLRVGDRFQLPYGYATIAQASLPSIGWQQQETLLERLAASTNTVLIQQKPFAPPALESPTSERDRRAQRHFFDDWLVP